MRRLNLGCGPYPKPDFINIDKNPVWKPDLVRDVRRGLPYDDSSVAEVAANAFLEHLEPLEVIDLLEEIWRVLVPGGKLMVGVPLGVTGIFDHKMIFTDKSFDHFFNDAEAATYYGKTFRWRLVTKEIAPPEPLYGLEMLVIEMEAVKDGS